MKRRATISAIVSATAWVASNASAGVVQDIALGLGYTGFNIQGSHNILSGGADFSIGRNFVGNPLDFGAWDLTLQGPLLLSASTGGRLVPTFDISLQTALDNRGQASPLGYLINSDVGSQETQIAGTLLIDADVSINSFGFYDLNLNYSSRQNVDNDGRLSDENLENDFDLGPINISGNIFADALAVITEPLFARAGVINPFTSFSGNSQLQVFLNAASAGSQGQLTSGTGIVDSLLSPVIEGLSSQVIHSLDAGATFPLGAQERGSVGGGFAAIPEPPVILLLLAGLSVVLRRKAFV